MEHVILKLQQSDYFSSFNGWKRQFLIKCYDKDDRKVKYTDILMHLEMQGQGYQAYIIRDMIKKWSMREDLIKINNNIAD